MHYHAEVVVTDRTLKEGSNDIKRCVGKAMISARREIGWDWYVIGGRWSGVHTLHMLDPKIRHGYFEEYEKLGLGWTDLEHTDKMRRKQAWDLWKKYFPKYKGTPPVYRDQYKEDGFADDVIGILDCPPKLDCSHLVLPKVGKGTRSSPSRARVLSVERWTGKDLVKTDFKGLVQPALKEAGIEEGKLVTVDFHS